MLYLNDQMLYDSNDSIDNETANIKIIHCEYQRINLTRDRWTKEGSLFQTFYNHSAVNSLNLT